MDGGQAYHLPAAERLANGMCFDGQGHLIACADEKNELWSIDVATKKVTVLFAVRGQAPERPE